MRNLNSEFLSQIRRDYKTENLEDIFAGFSCYRLTLKKETCFLFLNNDPEKEYTYYKKNLF